MIITNSYACINTRTPNYGNWRLSKNEIPACRLLTITCDHSTLTYQDTSKCERQLNFPFSSLGIKKGKNKIN